MHIKVVRRLSDKHSTVSDVYVDDRWICFGLEDEPRKVKVAGKTRIPAGLYPVKVRTEGGFHSRYAKRFPEFHKGMLHIQDIPDFTFVLIHCGNTHEHTAGCLLVGDDAYTNYGDMRLVSSSAAYERLYKRVIDTALAEDLTIEYVDEDL